MTNGASGEVLEGTPAERTQAKLQQRERSSIQFPYHDLDAAIGVARAINENAGGECGLDQLAPWLKHDTVSSGTFRTKLAAARIFGLIEVGRDRATLTPLGREIANPASEKRARVIAFLTVPLYSAVFEKYRGFLLPGPPGLENVMGQLGVASKQTATARQVFQRSAGQAGFFSEGRDRLVRPAERPGKEAEPIPAPIHAKRSHDGGLDGDGGGGGTLHPFIQGLLQTLPPPGASWPKQKRDQWLAAATGIFNLIYLAEDG